jgi:multiple sugar transport system substrate-binding protein
MPRRTLTTWLAGLRATDTPWFWLALCAVAALVVTLVVTVVVPLANDPAATEKGELVILSGRDDSVSGQRQVLINEWNRLNPDNPARIVGLSGLADQQRNEMVKHAQSGKSTVDIYNLDVTWTAEFAEAGYIKKLDEDAVDVSGFLDKPLATCRYDGELYALPFNTDAGLLYYRKDLVPLAPDSWDAIKSETLRVFSGPHDPALVAGYATQLDNYEGLTVNVLEAIRAAGGEAVNDDGELVIDLSNPRVNQEGVDRLRARPGEDPQIILRDSRRHNEAESTRAFRDGEVLFMRNWPVAYRTLVQSTGGDTGAGSPPFAVTQLPGGSVLGGQNLAISSNSSKPRAAQELIEFLTDERSQQLLFERGGFAATRGVIYSDPAVLGRYEYAQDLLKAINGAIPRPRSACYERFSKVFRNTVTEALQTGNPLPVDFADQLASARRCRPLE